MNAPIVGLLLAAGASRRFGADKLKQPLPDGDWIAVHACRNLQAGTGRVLAVVRPGSEILAERLRDEGAKVAVCANAEQGMGTSLSFGVRTTVEAGGWLIALADMPWIEAETIRSIAEALRQGAPLAAPCFQGRRGHPVGFSGVYRGELAALNGDGGAQSLLQAHIGRLRLIDCADPGVLLDIDEAADLAL